MFEIGGSLRAAREHRQLPLSEVERATHIRAKYLVALEEERFDVLPGTAYAKGFLRTYADFLGLDGTQFVDEFNERYAPDELPEASPPVPVEAPRRLPSARLLVIPLLVVAIGLFAWRLSSGGGGRAHQQTAVAPPVTHVRVTTAVAPPRAAAATRPKRAQISFVAARGSCWLSVRLGSSAGRVLYDRTLQLGQRAQFAGTQLWIRIGAPWNLDATLNGKHVELPTSVASVVVSRKALRPA